MHTSACIGLTFCLLGLDNGNACNESMGIGEGEGCKWKLESKHETPVTA